MASLEADGAPPQPPHPTMPPYSLKATHLQSSKPKAQEERPRIPQEWQSQSLGTKYLVETLVGVPTTMAIPTTTAGTDTMFLTAHQQPLTSFTAHSHRTHFHSNSMESKNTVIQADPNCCTSTRYRHATTQPNETTATIHHYMSKTISKNKNKKDTTSFTLDNSLNKLPVIPEHSRLLLQHYHLPHHPVPTTTYQLTPRQRNIKTKTSETNSAHYTQPPHHPCITIDTTAATHGNIDRIRNCPFMRNNRMQQSKRRAAVISLPAAPNIFKSSPAPALNPNSKFMPTRQNRLVDTAPHRIDITSSTTESTVLATAECTGTTKQSSELDLISSTCSFIQWESDTSAATAIPDQKSQELQNSMPAP